MLSEGDRVVMQLLMEGTHQGTWLGIPERPILYFATDTVRVLRHE